jgi:hypothetical protein
MQRQARGDLDAPRFPTTSIATWMEDSGDRPRDAPRGDLVIGAAVLAPVVVKMAKAMR